LDDLVAEEVEAGVVASALVFRPVDEGRAGLRPDVLRVDRLPAVVAGEPGMMCAC
jgi:hypothetical protein